MWEYNSVYPDELYHYGVLGMKWGVHRARLSATTQRRVGDAYTTRQKNVMKRQARRVANKQISGNNRDAAAYRSSESYYRSKSSKYARKSADAKARGNSEKSSKYAKKSKQYVTTADTKAGMARLANRVAKVADQMLSDIQSGKLQAGRDYVTNSRTSTNLILDAVGVINVGREVWIDRK